MTFNEQDVERIVIEVIHRLGLIASPRASAQAELIITDRVVAMHSIDGRLAGITRLIVGPRAVVTPAVRDELNQRKIALVRQATL